jgi:hypothetical protein
MNTTINNLYPKFYPYLLGHQLCPATFKSEIDALFAQGKLPFLKDAGQRQYIFDGGKYILKLNRPNGLTTHDTHLYRIRKAVKIQNYIQRNGLENHIMVPKKYLYWNKKESQFYVVCEKIPLSEEVVQPAPQYVTTDGAHYGGQWQKFIEGKPRKTLQPIQAKALAELAVLGYTDLSYNNLYFTLDGRVAIIDTEPLKRGLNKKKFAKYTIDSWLNDKASFLAQQSIAGIAKLKMYCTDRAAFREVEKVERNHALWNIAKLIGKIAIGCLVIYFTPSIVAFLPVAGVAIATLKITIIAIATTKIVYLSFNALAVYSIWNKSMNGYQGLVRIVQAEIRGAF